MKLTDIYPGITINDFFIELRNDDVIINRKEYRLARIYNIPERKYPAFSYDVIFLRNKKVKNLKIDDLIFVPDKFAEEPVSWMLIKTYENDITDGVLEQDVEYMIIRNKETFFSWYEDPNFCPEQIFQMIRKHPFDFNMIDWEKEIVGTRVNFLGIPGYIKSATPYYLSCQIIIKPEYIKELNRMIDMVYHQYINQERYIMSILSIKIDITHFEAIVDASLLNPNIKWILE